MPLTDTILILSFTVNSIITITKNIKYIKTGCFVCEKEQDLNQQEIENLFEQTMKNLETLKNKTPRSAGMIK